MTKDEALKLALEALKEDRAWLETDAPTEVWEKNNEAITAIKAALEAKDEPVAWMYGCVGKGRMYAEELDDPAGWQPLYTTPPQRTWAGLTDEEIVLIVAECAASHQHTDIHFARAIEAKLKEKNT